MSYILKDGKRYYKDDLTGRLTLDNVSQAEADRRAQRNQGVLKSSGATPSLTITENGRITSSRTPLPTSTGNARIMLRTANVVRQTRHAEFPRKAVVAFAVIVLLAAAAVYDHLHISPEEQAITNYMLMTQEPNTISDASETVIMPVTDVWTNEEDTAEKTSSGERYETASYLVPDSAERYLEVGDIETYNPDEIQLIINEIYARHGRAFKSQENSDYFNAQTWYDPVPGKSDEEIVREFNEYELANVELLCKYL